VDRTFVMAYFGLTGAMLLAVTVLAPWIAHRKGKPWPLWLLYTLILPGISLIHALLLHPRGFSAAADGTMETEQSEEAAP